MIFSSSVNVGRLLVWLTGVTVGSSTKLHKQAADGFYSTLIQVLDSIRLNSIPSRIYCKQFGILPPYLLIVT